MPRVINVTVTVTVCHCNIERYNSAAEQLCDSALITRQLRLPTNAMRGGGQLVNKTTFLYWKSVEDNWKKKLILRVVRCFFFFGIPGFPDFLKGHASLDLSDCVAYLLVSIFELFYCSNPQTAKPPS